MLTDQPPLRSDLCRTLCRAVHYQSNIAVINLSRVRLEDDGIRHLVDALATIRPKTLKLSGNHITAIGIQHFTRKLNAPLTTPETPSFLSDLRVLDLSYNPLGDGVGAVELRTLLGHCPALQTLTLCSTGLRQLDASSRLLALTELDVGYNRFTMAALRKMLLQLNACKLVELRLGFCCAGSSHRRSGGLDDVGSTDVKALIEFLQSGTLDALRILDISGWRLDDSDMYELVHTLRRARQLDAVWAMENNLLGSIGFAQLVRNVRTKNLYLDGCSGVVRNLCAEIRPTPGQPETSSGGTIVCSSVRLPKLPAAETDVLREFWTHLHGARATVVCSKLKTLLNVQSDH